MRKCTILVGFLLFALSSSAQVRWNAAYQEYIDQYKNIAIEQMKRYHIPASITLAQGLFESGAGRSELTRRSNNHFGIKCHGWSKATYYQDDDEVNECFRAYNNAFESYEDHSLFLKNNSRYSSLFSLNTDDYKGWARGLRACGYATNPQYADKLIDIIQLYKLYQLDESKGYNHFILSHSHGTSINGMPIHAIHEFNKNYYVVVRLGDTFYTLSKEVGISARKLARYNERDKRDPLQVGEYIYLKKKKRKAPKDYNGRLHYVRTGESMYTISQLYGIRLKYLYKMNQLSPDYQIKVGDSLRLR
jgi:LysM repeat protein